MTRKTADVAELVANANKLLALPDVHGLSEDLSPQFRWGVIAMVERVLFDSGNYRGFQHLRSEYLPAAEQTAERVLRDGYDETRRRYF